MPIFFGALRLQRKGGGKFDALTLSMDEIDNENVNIQKKLGESQNSQKKQWIKELQQHSLIVWSKRGNEEPSLGRRNIKQNEILFGQYKISNKKIQKTYWDDEQ